MAGRLEWIGISPEPRAEVRALDEAAAIAGKGLEDDHHAKQRRSRREVTLIQHEYLPLIASDLGLPEVRPERLRRNLVVSGIELAGLVDRTISVGDAILQITGTCPPCGRMEETLGHGGRKAMRGRGGMTAKVVASGKLRVGDEVKELNRP